MQFNEFVNCLQNDIETLFMPWSDVADALLCLEEFWIKILSQRVENQKPKLKLWDKGLLTDLIVFRKQYLVIQAISKVIKLQNMPDLFVSS